MSPAGRKAALWALGLVVCLSLVLCVSAASNTERVKAHAKVGAAQRLHALSLLILMKLLSELKCQATLHVLQAQTTGWEVTLERQKLRAQALLDEFASLIEYGARKVLGNAHLEAGDLCKTTFSLHVGLLSAWHVLCFFAAVLCNLQQTWSFPVSIKLHMLLIAVQSCSLITADDLLPSII